MKDERQINLGEADRPTLVGEDLVAGRSLGRDAWRRLLKNRQIAGAAIDVFDIEPLPPSHPFRTLDNVLATPHIGYVSHGLYKTFYEDTVSNIRQWLDAHFGRP